MTEDQASRRGFFTGSAGATILAAGVAAAAGSAALVQPRTAGAQAVSSLEAIRSSGRVRMGVAPAEPWAFVDPASGTRKGLSISFGNAIASALGVELVVAEMAFPSLIAGLQSDQVDFVPVLDGTPARALAVDFTLSPLVFHAQAVLVADDMEIKSWADLSKPEISIAVPQGSVMETNARRLAPKAEILAFPNNPETVAAFQSGRATAASLFGPALTMLQARLRRGRIVVPQPMRLTQSQVGVKRFEDKAFLRWMDSAVSFYYVTGEVTAWYNDFLAFRGIDPAAVPSIQRETW